MDTTTALRRTRPLALRSGRAARAACAILFTFFTSLGILGASGASAQVAKGDDRDAVLAVVQRLFDGMRAKEALILESVFAPDARLGSRDARSFIEGVVSSERYLDEVTFDETVLIDKDLAMAWTPYNLFVDGDFHHCGVDLFVLRRKESEWQITHLDDTRRSEACDPERRS